MTARVSAGPGPRPGARPLVIVRQRPTGGTCAYDDRALVPALAIYDDGTVLTADRLGFFCERLPSVTAGSTDPDQVGRRVRAYFDSVDAPADVPGRMDVADGLTTQISYRPAGGAPREAEAYALDVAEYGAGLPAAQRRARTAFESLVADLMRLRGTTPWPARTVLLTGIEDWVPRPALAPLRWPVPVTSAVRRAAAGGCAELQGEAAAAVIAAQRSRPAGSDWMIDRKRRTLAVGIALPGLGGCGG